MEVGREGAKVELEGKKVAVGLDQLLPAGIFETAFFEYDLLCVHLFTSRNYL